MTDFEYTDDWVWIHERLVFEHMNDWFHITKMTGFGGVLALHSPSGSFHFVLMGSCPAIWWVLMGSCLAIWWVLMGSDGVWWILMGSCPAFWWVFALHLPLAFLLICPTARVQIIASSCPCPHPTLHPMAALTNYCPNRLDFTLTQL
jgi:hypothetical protein